MCYNLTRSMPNDRIQSFGDHFYFILFLKRTYFYKFFLVFLFALWHLLPEILNKQLFNSHVAKCNEFFYVAIISTFFGYCAISTHIAQSPGNTTFPDMGPHHARVWLIRWKYHPKTCTCLCTCTFWLCVTLKMTLNYLR